MPCFHPMPAWRSTAGELSFDKRRAPTSIETLAVPCGGCLGCRTARAREWTVRCTLEQQDHEHTSWCTLTYDESNKPPTLSKPHLAGWLKRLRARVAPHKVRFFASGEYGEQTQRPHYHAVLYGLPSDCEEVQNSWPYGYVRTDKITPAAIAYVAGYSAKKVGWRLQQHEERVDPTTGEVYYYEPPFIQMSRRPGIGGNARQYWRSWRETAVIDGLTIPVPRYLHEAWKNNTTKEEHEELQHQRNIKISDKTLKGAFTPEKLENRLRNEQARQTIKAQRRNKL